MEVPVETLAEVRSRLQKGTVKRVLFDALEEAGPAGLNIASLVDAVQVPLLHTSALSKFVAISCISNCNTTIEQKHSNLKLSV